MIETHCGRGSITVIGTGIRAIGQLTVESIAAIRRCDVLVHLASDSVGEVVLAEMKPGRQHSLRSFYQEGVPRREIYKAMVAFVLDWARKGESVCAAFYGHPGVFAQVPHDIISGARDEAIPASMLAAISAEDCLIADLGIDPGRPGCCSYEATDFLLYHRGFDPSAHLLLWQVDALGEWDHRRRHSRRALPLLVEKLANAYPLDHEVTAYAAPTVLGAAPVVELMPLEALTTFVWRPSHTLYIPPCRRPRPDERFAAAFRSLP